MVPGIPANRVFVPCWIALSLAWMSAMLLDHRSALGEDKEVPGRQLLAPPERSQRPDLKPAALPIDFFEGERIALVGNSLAEKMNLHGDFEAKLHAAFPEKRLSVRNFARPADEVAVRQRPGNYDLLDDPLYHFSPDTVFCFFGFNESYAGEEQTDAFVRNYVAFLEQFSERYRRDDTGSRVRFVLVGPIAFENTNDPLLPNSEPINQRLAKYSAAVKQVAALTGWPAVELFDETRSAFDAKPGCQYTLAGFQVNAKGCSLVADILCDKIIDSKRKASAAKLNSSQWNQLIDLVNDKSWLHQQDYRMVNGWYVYGGRRTWDHETFPREYNKIRQMARVRDQAIWAVAAGRAAPAVNDQATEALIVPPTRFGTPTQSYSEPKDLKYLTPDEFIAATQVPEGFEIQLFAEETRFPELAKPVQLNFDNKGRLWVACMPTYPQWRPGDGRPDDKLVILEDTDRDGKADKSTVFYNKLHCPTGFEFFNGGVLVVDQPRLIWLKDNDGDDRADQVVEYMDGWGTDDTHHTIGAFEFSHGGLLHMLEGVAMSTTLETPWGPKRWSGAAGSYVFDPKTFEISRFTTPGYGNPWCMMFEPWGQGIVGDGTNAQQHWATALSGNQIGPRRGLNPIFDNQGMRPALGNELIYSRHFPDAMQGQLTYACVINMNGLPRFTMNDDGAGFAGTRIMRADGTPDDLIRSTDKNFRPADPQIGPDGALWFGDWCNALIGHMQYSQRDPNRDHVRGRIYRLVHKNRPLLTPATQFGKTERELLDQLLEFEPRTRARVRRELSDRDTAKVVAAINAWLPTIADNHPEKDRLLCEAMWVLQNHRRFDAKLTERILQSKEPRARAAAVHAVSNLSRFIPNAQELLVNAASDLHPRVRAEAARALSFFQNEAGVDAILKVAESPMDPWLEYVTEHAIAATQSTWEPLYKSGALAQKSAKGLEAVDRYLASNGPGIAAEKHIQLLVQPAETRMQVARNNAYAALEALKGNAKNGQQVFARVCANCHKVGDKGYQFGPELTQVAVRLNRRDLIESIVEPSAKMDQKYISEQVRTNDDEVLIGFVAKETDEELVLSLPEGKSRTLNKADDIAERKQALQSSMPENLGVTVAPTEFLDLIEYLTTLK
ncbi:MAG: HEAT repeat domain-containing protein [Pirellula sp.]|nr:HEAT repeat domain-containing protein [Pirellula sp.]